MSAVPPTDRRTSDLLVLPPSQSQQADPSRDRTAQVAQRDLRPISLTPRGGRVEREFPIDDFQRAVKAVDFESIKRILVLHGFKQHEVDFMQAKAKLLSNKVDPDLLIDILLYTAVQKSFLTYLPALPAYIKPAPRRFAELCQLATDRFCTNMTMERFDMLLTIVKKYKPDNAEECVRRAYGIAVKKEEKLIQKCMVRAFQEYHLRDKDAEEKNDAEPVKHFPEFLFRMFLADLDSDDFCKILIQNGWQESDLDIVRLYMKQLLSERKRFSISAGACISLSSLDDICSRLISEGIINQRLSLLQILPLLPAFDSFSADNHIQHTLKHAADLLCKEPDNLFLVELFSKLACKYRPGNLVDFINQVEASQISEEDMARIRSEIYPS